ncbi:uncharacterized protein LOC144878181 [Branchiostoma floridae x Branchiostoma japonicum]
MPMLPVQTSQLLGPVRTVRVTLGMREMGTRVQISMDVKATRAMPMLLVQMFQLLGPGQECTCNAGYEGDGYTCTDIDGCDPNPCDANAACADVPAPGTGQECTCNTGYEGDGYTCTDIDGCDPNPCDPQCCLCRRRSSWHRSGVYV